jgi:hypothetical protein
VILRTNHRLRWPPTFPSAIILQPEAREQAVMVLQAGDNSYEEPEPASQAKSRPRKPLVLQCQLRYAASSAERLDYSRPEPLFAPFAVPTVERAVWPELLFW